MIPGNKDHIRQYPIRGLSPRSTVQKPEEEPFHEVHELPEEVGYCYSIFCEVLKTPLALGAVLDTSQLVDEITRHLEDPETEIDIGHFYFPPQRREIIEQGVLKESVIESMQGAIHSGNWEEIVGAAKRITKKAEYLKREVANQYYTNPVRINMSYVAFIEAARDADLFVDDSEALSISIDLAIGSMESYSRQIEDTTVPDID